MRTNGVNRAPAAPLYNLHGQSTVISQVHDVFHAPYAGLNSTPRHEGWKTSITGTLDFGLRLPWTGGEFYFDPEIAGGETSRFTARCHSL